MIYDMKSDCHRLINPSPKAPIHFIIPACSYICELIKALHIQEGGCSFQLAKALSLTFVQFHTSTI